MKAQLENLLTRNPEQKHAVIVTCSSKPNFGQIELHRLMDTIFSGELTGKEIRAIASLDEVLSIELDQTIEL
ncbi:hypothetical protein [Fluviicola taffensis]|nr:hypothetical protein [Fluviicola taffensis]